LDLVDPVPDHSTLSQNRRRRFKESDVFQEIFDHIVFQCIEKGLVTGEVVVVDSTHVKASASVSKAEKVVIHKKPTDYFEELEKEVRKMEIGPDHDPDKKKRGKKRKEGPIQKEIQRSTTDPESGMLSRPNKPRGFHYLAHTSVDTKHGIITDIHVTPANINDHEPFARRLQVQKEKYGLEIRKVGADKGYDRSGVHHQLEQLKIKGYVSPILDKGSQSDSRFEYNSEQDLYVCPSGQTLVFSYIKWHSKKQSYSKVYGAKAKDCKSCLLRSQCFGQSGTRRTIERQLFQEAKERNQTRAQSKEYKKIQKDRRVWCEGSFGTMKKHHNLSETHKRGIRNVTEHCLLSALALNIKRIIKAVS
jgi:IS5 family transposase